jgi:hypothetical protein
MDFCQSVLRQAGSSNAQGDSRRSRVRWFVGPYACIRASKSKKIAPCCQGKYGIDYGRHMRDLQRIRDVALENGAYSAAVQAEYRRGQAANMYVSRSEVLHGSIDQMSKADVEKALAEVKKQLGEEEKVIEGEVIDSGSEVLEAVEDRLLTNTTRH